MAKSEKPVMFQHLKAKNNKNGNPRRVFIFMNKWGCILFVCDEGYSGTPKQCRGLIELPSLKVPVSLYKEILRIYPNV